MSFENFEEIIHFAIEKEIEAVAFYEDVSKQEPYSGVKEAFVEFAQEEKKHQAMLEGFLKGETIGAGYQFKWIPDLKRSDYMVDVVYEKGMHYTDILRLAMKREEKSLKLYNELLQKVDKEDLGKVFKMLCQEEAKHKLALETMYDDYMAKQGD